MNIPPLTPLRAVPSDHQASINKFTSNDRWFTAIR